MNTRTHTDPFAPAHMRVKRCFCGKLTVEDHDFCFCSPDCARSHAMRALRGDDCHYRKVVRKAYVNCGAPEPAIYRRKSEDHLRRFPIAKRASGIIPRLPSPPKPTHQYNKPTIGVQGGGYAQKEKVFPTLAQVTSAVFARKAKHGGDSVETSTTNLVAAQISHDAVSLPPNTPAQQTKPVFGRGPCTQAPAQLRSAPQRIVPLKVNKKIAGLRRQPSLLHPQWEWRTKMKQLFREW